MQTQGEGKTNYLIRGIACLNSKNSYGLLFLKPSFPCYTVLPYKGDLYLESCLVCLWCKLITLLVKVTLAGVTDSEQNARVFAW